MQFAFIACQIGDLKYIETKQQVACFYLILGFLKKQQEV